MRALWIWLARRVPSHTVTTRLVPWITLAMGAFGATWTLLQYSNSIDIQRSNTTLAIHRQFVSVFPIGVQEITGHTSEDLTRKIFKIRCDVYASAIADGVLSADERMPACETIALADRVLLDEIGATAPDSIRRQIRVALEDVVLTNAATARRMMTYFRSLQVCAEGRQCDFEITSELFAGDFVAFLNATCDLADRDPEFARQGEMLGLFARSLLPQGTIPWTTDPNRRDLFRCKHLRS